MKDSVSGYRYSFPSCRTLGKMKLWTSHPKSSSFTKCFFTYCMVNEELPWGGLSPLDVHSSATPSKPRNHALILSPSLLGFCKVHNKLHLAKQTTGLFLCSLKVPKYPWGKTSCQGGKLRNPKWVRFVCKFMASVT